MTTQTIKYQCERLGKHSKKRIKDIRDATLQFIFNSELIALLNINEKYISDRKYWEDKKVSLLYFDSVKLSHAITHSDYIIKFIVNANDYPDTFVKELPDENIEKYYIDQSFRINSYASSFYTQHGIKGIDSFFCKEIRKCKFDKKVLENSIKRNPHLHNVIKTNLLSNLL